MIMPPTAHSSVVSGASELVAAGPNLFSCPEAVVTFWLALTIYGVVRFVHPRFWPGAIVWSTLKRSRDAQERLMGDLHLLAEREVVLEEKVFRYLFDALIVYV